MSQWIDISVPVVTGLVHWPGDVDVNVNQVNFLERGDVCNLSRMSMSVHTGTHMDAPRHFVANGGGMDDVPLDALLGPARVLHILGTGRVTASDLAPHNPQRGERILLRTQNSDAVWWTKPFNTEYAHLSRDAAELLVERGVVLIGVDYLSVGAFEGDGVETHQVLLGAKTVIVEGLDLTRVEAGSYELACLPMKLAGCDGAPTRAVIRPR